jgi:tetratricopeptide (TPR) repeat protein
MAGVLRLIILLALVATVALAVVYNRPTAQWVSQWTLQQQADGLLARRDWEGLKELCQRELMHYPKHPGLLKGLAAYYLVKKPMPDQAQRYLTTLLAVTPADGGARLAYANLLNQHYRQPDKALQVLYEGVTHQPDNTQIPYQMGTLYLEQITPQLPQAKADRLYQLAQPYFKAVLTRNPKHYGALFQLGRVAMRLQQWPAAVGYFCQCAAMAPQDERAWFNLGASVLPLGYKPAGYALLHASVQKAPSPQRSNAMMLAIQALHNQYPQPWTEAKPANNSVLGAVGVKDRMHNKGKKPHELLPAHAEDTLGNETTQCLTSVLQQTL